MLLIKHLRAIAFLPVTVLIVIPALIIYSTRSINLGWSLPPPLRVLPVILGLFFMILGLILLIQTVSLFATAGQGTLAPWDPPQKLVVKGIYRYVRNPMISGVSSVLLGESLAIGSVPLAYWLMIFMILNLTYIPLIEELGLEQRFGDEYKLYKQNVPRWIPRRRPWR